VHYGIFRTDRIGDLVLTLPLAEAITRHDPAARVTFIVQDYTRPLLSLAPHIDDVISIGGRDLEGGVRRFASVLREKHIDAAVFAYPRPRLALAAALARIPARVGTGRRWYAPLFTHRRNERRRDGDSHEMEYNLRLLEELGIPASADIRPVLHIDETRRAAATDILRRAGIDTAAPFAALHPGSGGSARDWPAERFARLARGLLAESPATQILVTGTAAELPLMETVARGDARIRVLREPLALDIIAAVLAEARLFAANSTGPLHIAAACDVPVLGFYPFGRAIHARRWGPRAAHAIVLSPDPDPSCAACVAGACPAHDDMRTIDVPRALAAARLLLESSLR
jgi:ADP-heptose:LPS heptosyltransferase